MREIKIPLKKIESWQKNLIGKSLEIPIKVDWEELQLTEEELFANSVAWANGGEIPFPDKSIFCVKIEREGV